MRSNSRSVEVVQPALLSTLAKSNHRSSKGECRKLSISNDQIFRARSSMFSLGRSSRHSIWLNTVS
jgi:hypothetical protein